MFALALLAERSDLVTNLRRRRNGDAPPEADERRLHGARLTGAGAALGRVTTNAIADAASRTKMMENPTVVTGKPTIAAAPSAQQTSTNTKARPVQTSVFIRSLSIRTG
jgi:hypothetical protein